MLKRDSKRRLKARARQGKAIPVIYIERHGLWGFGSWVLSVNQQVARQASPGLYLLDNGKLLRRLAPHVVDPEIFGRP